MPDNASVKKNRHRIDRGRVGTLSMNSLLQLFYFYSVFFGYTYYDEGIAVNVSIIRKYFLKMLLLFNIRGNDMLKMHKKTAPNNSGRVHNS